MKAILVIDMPEKCSECKYSSALYCRLDRKKYPLDRKRKDCPLRPLPEADIKKILEITKHKSQAYKFGFIDGFDYYEKILKELGDGNVLGETE